VKGIVLAEAGDQSGNRIEWPAVHGAEAFGEQ
jgi:hypothetical protein